MVQQISKEEFLLKQLIKIAQHHKKTCIGRECDIALHSLYEVAQMAGLPVTVENLRHFG